MDISFFDQDNNSTGALTSTISKDSQAIEGFGGATFGQVLNSIAILVGGLIMAIAVNWRLGFVCTACVPILVGCGFMRLRILTGIAERAKTSYERSGMFV